MPARSVIFRLLAAAPLCVLSACASNAASQADVGALRAELQSLRESQARLTERLQRLEAHAAVDKVRSGEGAAKAAPSNASPSPSGDGLGATPELAVVKLKPRNEPAPKLPTAVAVVEPDSEQMEMFISAVPDGASASSGGDAATVVSSRDDAAEEKDPDVLDAEYDKAVSLLRTGNVEGGVERLRRFAEENPRHPRADNALYFSGLGLIGLSEFKDAARTFERLIKTYPAGDAMLDSMLRLAECRMRLNQAADAKALYTRVVTQFPGTAAATQAEQRLAALPQ
ncbi:tetratricopeptide repeat protein [Pyxidicoccus parkwayensis]|uniref:Tetratricopeptide repeat protein n=1 Tax=Pyxidicoccus parkwayensis TaxID=2813578 RepID=A0ABX7PA78_9BACT|nr:tetratricopeptide repeat protein [Pyxidicoccus parkwaysis]QSQ27363.1 tetratricopeptide repeat protein [Pyxidicoccus parkwaysis]